MRAPVDATEYTWWLVSRAAGVTSFALASVAVILGLVMAGRLAAKPGMARKLKAVHEHAALGSLVALAIHGLALLGDGWLSPGLTGVLVPFALDYRPLATGIGILAGYGMALLGLTFYVRRRIGAQRWRRAHRWTMLVWLLAALHALTAGSDAASPWLRAILGASAAAIAVLFAARLAESRSRAKAVASSRSSSPAAASVARDAAGA